MNSEQTSSIVLQPNSLQKRGYVLDQTERQSTDGDVVGVEELFEKLVGGSLFLINRNSGSSNVNMPLLASIDRG